MLDKTAAATANGVHLRHRLPIRSRRDRSRGNHGGHGRRLRRSQWFPGRNGRKGGRGARVRRPRPRRAGRPAVHRPATGRDRAPARSAARWRHRHHRARRPAGALLGRRRRPPGVRRRRDGRPVAGARRARRRRSAARRHRARRRTAAAPGHRPSALRGAGRLPRPVRRQGPRGHVQLGVGAGLPRRRRRLRGLGRLPPALVAGRRDRPGHAGGVRQLAAHPGQHPLGLLPAGAAVRDGPHPHPRAQAHRQPARRLGPLRAAGQGRDDRRAGAARGSCRPGSP